MTFIRKLICISVLLFSSYTSFAGNLIVFGDSFNDIGNLKAVVEAQGGAFPAETFNGRVSNGFVIVDVAARLSGQVLSPSLHLLGQNLGNNYAVAGARARTADEQPIHLEQQVGAFLLANQGIAKPEDTYIVFIGGNDVLDANSFVDEEERLFKRHYYNPYTTCGFRVNKRNGQFKIVKEALDSIQGSVQSLIDAGAKKIVVSNLIDINEVPNVGLNNSPKEAKVASFLSCQFNQRLSRKVKKLEKHNDIDIVLFDFASANKTVLREQAALGFSNTTQGCLTRDGFIYMRNDYCDLANDIDEFLFFDGQHYSAAGHEYIGRALFSVLPR